MASTSASVTPSALISGCEVVGRDLRARDEEAILARPGRLDAAVEEVRHVGVLLGLGDVELAPAGLAKAWASDRAVSGGKATTTGSPASYSVIVTTRRSVGGRAAGRRASVEAIEVVPVGERVGQLAGAVGAEVERGRSASPSSSRSVDAVDDRRRDELVVLAARVGRLDRVGRRRCARRRASPWTIAS